MKKFSQIFESDNMFENEITNFFVTLCEEHEIPFLSEVTFKYEDDNKVKIELEFALKNDSESQMPYYYIENKWELKYEDLGELLKDTTDSLLSDFNYYFESIEFDGSEATDANIDYDDKDVYYYYHTTTKTFLNRANKTGLLDLKK